MPIKTIPGQLHLSQENGKLGHVQSFSITPHMDCPGETAECAAICYAAKGTSLYFGGPYWAHNSSLVRENPAKILDLVPIIRGPMFRIHVGGDFFSPEYVEAWTKVAILRPDTHFWTYTRSWRIPIILPELIELSSLPNVTVWASCDRGTGEPPVGFKRAWLALTDTDTPPYPVDLVFRAVREARMPRMEGVVVCPVENGIKAGKEMNCKKCGICFR